MPTYYVKPGAHIKGDVQAVGEELDRIAGGGLTPARVADLAADGKTYPALHRQFEWDDEVAAQKYRVNQAGYVIRSVTVVYDSDPEQQPIRAYQPVVLNKGEPEFVPTRSALEIPELREQVMSRAYRELASFRRKYDYLREFAQVFDAIDNLPEQAELLVNA